MQAWWLAYMCGLVVGLDILSGGDDCEVDSKLSSEAQCEPAT